MKHFLSIESSSADELRALLASAHAMKARRQAGEKEAPVLQGQCWGMVFSKSSTRTRVSFEVGVRELGGDVMFLSANDLQLGRGEPIADTARVMGRMLGGAIIRTFDQQEVEDFAEYAKIPTINALTDAEHPCQIVADLMTVEEKRGNLDNLKVCFLGDANCNVARSWMWAAKYLNFELILCGPASPEGLVPDEVFLKALDAGDLVRVESDPVKAVEGADVLYTDVWVSMGKEEEAGGRLEALAPYQVNRALLDQVGKEAMVMHCLPAYREKEITEEVLEMYAETIFTEAENRLHAQKAIMARLMS